MKLLVTIFFSLCAFYLIAQEKKVVDKKYSNGIQKLSYTVFKFNNRDSDKYWHIGKAQMNYKNGQEFVSMECDSNGYFIGNKMVYYYKDGNPFIEIELFNISQGEFVQKIKKGYIKKPFNKLYRKFDKKGRIILEKTWYEPRNLKHTGNTKIYTYNRDVTKIVEREYKNGKKISKREYELD
uniref:hypothetical protein n=1 Tax=uncultured Draconibacterium sp. TaxID=1573823 RepID=UPI0032173403